VNTSLFSPKALYSRGVRLIGKVGHYCVHDDAVKYVVRFIDEADELTAFLLAHYCIIRFVLYETRDFCQHILAQYQILCHWAYILNGSIAYFGKVYHNGLYLCGAFALRLVFGYKITSMRLAFL